MTPSPRSSRQYGLQSNWFAVTSQASGGIGGYWLAAADGGVFSFGDAGFHGSAGNIRLVKPVVGMAATPDDGGYWLVARRRRACSPTATPPSTARPGTSARDKPVVGMAPTPDGGGYWLVASDGGVFSYGDAAFHGSMGKIQLDAPVVGMAAHARRRWLLAGGGGRRGLLLRRRRLPRLDGRAAAGPARDGHGAPRPTAAATGSWPRTAACSPSATPASQGRCPGRAREGRGWRCSPPARAPATSS